MKLIDFAVHHGADLLPPISDERITEFESKTGLRLPHELRQFYREAGGTNGNGFTKWDWRIWPFDELTTLDNRLRTIPDIKYLHDHSACPDLRDYIAFCDVLIEAPLYAFCGRKSIERYSEVISLSGGNSPFLAGPIKTFTEFLEILSVHWDDIVLPDAK